MKFISITDLNGFVHKVNVNHITRIEEYPNQIIVVTSDNFGIRTSMTFVQLMAMTS